MTKIITEIAKLLWKALRLVLWKWLGPIIKRFAWLGVIVAGLVMLVIVLATRI